MTEGQRARLADHNWATATFTWAFRKLQITQAMAVKDPTNVRLWCAFKDHNDAIRELFEKWEPSNGPH